MERVYLSINLQNWITVIVIVAVTGLGFGLAGQVWQKMKAQ